MVIPVILKSPGRAALVGVDVKVPLLVVDVNEPPMMALDGRPRFPGWVQAERHRERERSVAPLLRGEQDDRHGSGAARRRYREDGKARVPVDMPPGGAGVVAPSPPCLAARTACWTLASALASRPGGGSTAGAMGPLRASATGRNSATTVWHSAQPTRWAWNLAASPVPRTPKAQPAASRWLSSGSDGMDTSFGQSDTRYSHSAEYPGFDRP